jgi:hypothetical protein
MTSKLHLGKNGAEPFRTHLEAFARNFVEGTFRDRWLHILCERPDKALNELHKFDRQRLESRCRFVSGDQDWRAISSRIGGEKGVFFDGSAPAHFMTLAEARSAMDPYPDDGLISFASGAVALFFHHDGSVWMCGFGDSRDRGP